jgi:hypothetical protein
MPFSTRILDQRAKRESERRQRALDRRTADQEEAAREELRRQEAIEEAKSFAAEIDLKEDKKRQMLNDLRAKMRKEKLEKARIAKRSAIEELIVQSARRKQQSIEALHQRKEVEQDQDAHNKEKRDLTLQDASEQRRQQQRDERAERDSHQDTINTLRARRAQEKQNKERTADRNTSLRTQQKSAKDDERRRKDEAQGKELTSRNEIKNRNNAEKQERESEEQSRRQKRSNIVKEQRLEEKERQNSIEVQQQHHAELMQKRQERERRQERLRTNREQQQNERRQRDDREERRQESLASLRTEAAKAAQQARADAIEESSNTPQKKIRPVLVDPQTQSVLSGALPWLKVVGNSIVTLAGDQVILRGLTLQGWDNQDSSNIDRLIDAITGWGATIVRIPLCQSSVTYDDGSYCQMLDHIITTVAGHGCYTCLSLCRMDTSSVFGSTPQGEPNYCPPMPGGDSIGMWRLLSQRYQNEPGVIFELFTAPHPASADDVSGIDYRADRYSTWCQMTIAELRSYAPAVVCILTAANYGTDTTVFPIAGTDNQPIPGIVYGVHVAPTRPLNWVAIRNLAQKRPIIVSEWTGTDTDLLWANRIAGELRGLSIGFCGGGAFVPPFYIKSGSGYIPTRMGMIIKRELVRSEEAVLPPVSMVPNSFLIPYFSNEGGIP